MKFLTTILSLFFFTLVTLASMISPPLCKVQGFPTTVTNRIQEGIKYLQNVKAPCTAKERYCQRVSCSYGSAIFLCNDNYHPISVHCKDVAVKALTIVKACNWCDPQKSQCYTQGQMFDTDQFNVLVRGDDC